MLIAYIVSTLLCLFKLCLSQCIHLNVDITQKIEKNGFHREILWLIETTPEKKWLNSSCDLSLKFILSAGMFVNPDEIADLNRAGELSAYVDGFVNVELAAHEATEHTIYIFLPKEKVNKISIKLPVHLRYQRSLISGGFGKVPLHKPSLLVYCKDSFSETCGNGLKVEAPCTFNADKNCIWKNLTYNSLFDEVELFVPIGDLDHYPIVAIFTLLLGCMGCIYILSLLSSSKF